VTPSTDTPLTDSMTRLRDEILAARQGREAFREELRRDSGTRHTEVQVWRSGVLKELAGARRIWAGLRSKSATVPTPPPAKTVVPQVEAAPPEPVSTHAEAPLAAAPATPPHSPVPPAHHVAAETAQPPVPPHSPAPPAHHKPAETAPPAAPPHSPAPPAHHVAAETAPPAERPAAAGMPKRATREPYHRPTPNRPRPFLFWRGDADAPGQKRPEQP